MSQTNPYHTAPWSVFIGRHCWAGPGPSSAALLGSCFVSHCEGELPAALFSLPGACARPAGVSQGLPGAARPRGPVLGRVHGAAPWEGPEAAAGAAREGRVRAAGRRQCGAAAAGQARTSQPGSAQPSPRPADRRMGTERAAGRPWPAAAPRRGRRRRGRNKP